MTPIKRILEKIEIVGSCWIYTGGLRRGYGKISINNKSVSTHRFVYEYYYGQLCPDLVIDHLCRNRACCHPDHLEEVTQKINVSRGLTGYTKGGSSGNAKKTHCKQGHEFNVKNTYIKKNGGRDCRTCNRLRSRKMEQIRHE